MRFYNTFKDRLIRDESRNKVPSESLSRKVPSDVNRYMEPLKEKPNHRPDLLVPRHGHKS